jgi:replicative DNA helicase
MTATAAQQSADSSSTAADDIPTRYLDRAVGGVTPGEWLHAQLPGALRFDAVVGYLDRAGVEYLMPSLRGILDGGGGVHLVVDFRDSQPRYGDLAWLVGEMAAYGERFTLRLAGGEVRLHSKVFLIGYADGNRRALVGSANLTGAGLGRNWESCVAVGSATVEMLDQIAQAVREWQMSSRAREVSAADIRAMADLSVSAPTGTSHVLAELLGPTLDVIQAVGANGEATTGVPTGINDLDRLLNGLQDGQMVAIAGRPGMGKSTLALDILRNAALRHGLPALLMTFEMSGVEVTQRLLAAEARVPLHILRSAQLSDDDWTRLARRMVEISEAPIFINDSCQPTLRHLIGEIRRVVRQEGIRIVAVDYVQMLGIDRRTDNRTQEVSEISRALKALAAELRVPIMAVCQLNRGPEGRTDKRPVLSDLRDSGQLEQDSDIVILLHRDDYYDKESPRAGEADFIVAKHRSGPTDTVTVAAQLHLARFVNMAT